MNSPYDELKRSTLAFAARFGFVTKVLFFEYLCPAKQERKYVYWRRLKLEKFLKSSLTFKDVRYLTPAGRKTIGGAIPARPIYFVEHDALVAKFYLEFKLSGLLVRSSTEYEMKTRPWDACSILGSDRFDKAPDLVVDLKSKKGFVRIAIEIERSRKTNFRYDQLALRYLGLRHVNLMLFCCNRWSTARAIERAFNADVFRKSGKIPGVLLISEFEKGRMNTDTKFLNKRMELKKLLLTALEQPETSWGAKEQIDRKPLCVNLDSTKGVA